MHFHPRFYVEAIVLILAMEMLLGKIAELVMCTSIYGLTQNTF
jgi:hypothetical protein